MRLPNSDKAYVDIEKLRSYCLNPAHIRGRHKARVFAAALNIDVSHSEWIQKKLLEAAQSEDAIKLESSEYGDRYLVRFEVEHEGRKAIILSFWLIRQDEVFPRLSSCYVE